MTKNKKKTKNLTMWIFTVQSWYIITNIKEILNICLKKWEKKFLYNNQHHFHPQIDIFSIHSGYFYSNVHLSTFGITMTRWSSLPWTTPTIFHGLRFLTGIFLGSTPPISFPRSGSALSSGTFVRSVILTNTFPGPASTHLLLLGTSLDSLLFIRPSLIGWPFPKGAIVHSLLSGSALIYSLIPGSAPIHSFIPGSALIHSFIPGSAPIHSLIPGSAPIHTFIPGPAPIHTLIPGHVRNLLLSFDIVLIFAWSSFMWSAPTVCRALLFIPVTVFISQTWTSSFRVRRNLSIHGRGTPITIHIVGSLQRVASVQRSFLPHTWSGWLTVVIWKRKI